MNFTALALVTPVPVIATNVPTDPLVGLKLVIVGAGGPVFTVNDPDESTKPPGVVTLMVPLIAPLGTEVLM